MWVRDGIFFPSVTQPTDLQVCVKLFDSVKAREDHHCAGIEDTGSEFICHRHDAPKTFKRFKEIDEHLRSHATSERDAVTASSLKISCPVCYKVELNLLELVQEGFYYEHF